MCRLVYNLSRDSRIQIKYVPDFPVVIKSKKIFNVDKIVSKLNKETETEGAETERQIKKKSEKMRGDIIPDSFVQSAIGSEPSEIIPDSQTHAGSTSTDTKTITVTVTNGLVSQHIPEIKYEDGSKSGPAWWSWME